MASDNSRPREEVRSGSISSVSTDVTGASFASRLENGSGVSGREDGLGSVRSRGHSEAERNRQSGRRDRSGGPRTPKFRLRHIQMMAFGSLPFLLLKLRGGSIGTGLFYGSGVVLYNAGPISAFLGYIIMGTVLFSVLVKSSLRWTEFERSRLGRWYLICHYLEPSSQLQIGLLVPLWCSLCLNNGTYAFRALPSVGFIGSRMARQRKGAKEQIRNPVPIRGCGQYDVLLVTNAQPCYLDIGLSPGSNCVQSFQCEEIRGISILVNERQSRHLRRPFHPWNITANGCLYRKTSSGNKLY
jgi:Amino acid permease